MTRGTERNNIIRYGSTLPYKAPVKEDKLPDWLLIPALRIAKTDVWDEEMPDHVTINEYHKGQGISWHIDSPTSGEIISVLSLKSEAIMQLRKGTEILQYVLSPRSLLQMTGEHRWEWEHCILPVAERRFSIVFRKGSV